MELIYQQEFTVTENLADRFGRAKSSAVLYFIQEAAGKHCRLLEADHDVLADRHLFWAISRNRVQIDRLPRLHETFTVETWPMPTTRVAYPRAVTARDKEGNVLFRSVSLWVLMDDRTRALVLPGKSGVTVPGTLTGAELSTPTSIAARPTENPVTRQVGFSLLDRNGHMNNTRYMDWVDDLLPSAFHEHHPVRELSICYLNEAREAEQIHLSHILSDGPVLTVNAERENGENRDRIFAAQVVF